MFKEDSNIDVIKELTKTLPDKPEGELPEEVKHVLDNHQSTIELLTTSISNLTGIIYPMKTKVKELENIINNMLKGDNT